MLYRMIKWPLDLITPPRRTCPRHRKPEPPKTRPNPDQQLRTAATTAGRLTARLLLGARNKHHAHSKTRRALNTATLLTAAAATWYTIHTGHTLALVLLAAIATTIYIRRLRQQPTRPDGFTGPKPTTTLDDNPPGPLNPRMYHSNRR